jgi:hypothetical protein
MTEIDGDLQNGGEKLVKWLRLIACECDEQAGPSKWTATMLEAADRIEALEREDRKDMLLRHGTWLAEQISAARREALEEAARVADRVGDVNTTTEYDGGMIIAATQIAHAIRALKGE